MEPPLMPWMVKSFSAYRVADGKGDGYFALRLWQNHVRFADFQVANIDNLK